MLLLKLTDCYVRKSYLFCEACFRVMQLNTSSLIAKLAISSNEAFMWRGPIEISRILLELNIVKEYSLILLLEP